MYEIKMYEIKIQEKTSNYDSRFEFTIQIELSEEQKIALIKSINEIITSPKVD